MKSWKEPLIKHTPFIFAVSAAAVAVLTLSAYGAHNTDSKDMNHGNNATSGGMNPGMNNGSMKSTHPAWPTASTIAGSPDAGAHNDTARWRQT